MRIYIYMYVEASKAKFETKSLALVVANRRNFHEKSPRIV